MTSERRLGLALALTVGLLAACSSGDDLVAPDQAVAPDSLVATPLGTGVIGLRWVKAGGSTGYQIERRINLQGDFTELTRIASPNTTTFSDVDVEAETIYSYRLRSISTTGVLSSPSIAVSARTPPVPGIEVITSTENNPVFTDGDGYLLTITRDGQPPVNEPMGIADQRRFSPLAPGDYVVSLTGVAPNCAVLGGEGSDRQNVTVTDQGVQTLQTVTFNVTCRNPDRGRVSVTIATTGDSLDADGYTLVLSGVADDTTLSDDQRAFLDRSAVPVQLIAPKAYEDLRPGAYTLELQDVAGNCTVQGSTSIEFRVERLADVSQTFAIKCQGAPDDPNRPLVLQSVWSPATAGSGSSVALDVGMDLARKSETAIRQIQATLAVDPTVVRFDSAAGQGVWANNANANEVSPGTIAWLAFVNTGRGQKGTTQFIRFYFTVVGAAGATTTTRETIDVATDDNPDEAQQVDLIPLTRREEGTLTVGSGGGGGGTNQSPVARLGAASYSGTAGAAVSFDGSTSSDPDGSIASYAWNFGDGATGTGATASHTYAAAGSFTVTLTVTDNQGAQGSITAPVTISAGGGGSDQPPVARLAASYNGTAGTPVAFDAGSSSDPDGTIAAYDWNFGDGATGTGVTASHTYAAAGSFTVTLTVTDNQGVQNAATAPVTISAGGAGGSGSLVWTNAFGTVNPATSLVSLNITYDLRTDISETPGTEALQSWAVDSLKWDPTVLQFYSFNFGPGVLGTLNTTDAFQGKLRFTSGLQPYNLSGLVAIATIQFKVIGAAGSSTTTQTALGPLVGTAATGFFGYNPKTTIQEGSSSGGGSPPPPTGGTVSGTITRTGGGTASLTGVGVTVTPSATGTSPVTTTVGAGLTYTASGVALGSGTGAGSGTVTLGTLPSGCTASTTSGTYSGLTDGGNKTVDFTVDCQGSSPAGGYQYTTTWGSITGGQVSLTLSFDPTTFNDPAINGANADDIVQFQADVGYDASKLTFVQCANGATPNGFTHADAFSAAAGSFTVLNFKNTNGTTTFGATTPVTLAVCSFTVNAEATGSVTSSTTFSVLDADGYGDTATSLIPKTQKTEGTLTIP
jgi:PKD repeat protein